MNFIGSKISLLRFLEDSIHEVAGVKSKTFCDLFAGTGAVGSYFKQYGYDIIANDIQYFAYVLNMHYVGNNAPLEFKGLVDYIPLLKDMPTRSRKDLVCSCLTGKDFYYSNNSNSFIYDNYCYEGTKGQQYERNYFSEEVARKCDAIRDGINVWYHEMNAITDKEYYFLLTSLLESVDRYANTASVYSAYLKKLKPSALKPFVMTAARDTMPVKGKHKIYREDALELIKKVKGDILYLDPPYNARQYATNYHILETIARGDKPEIYGKTGLRKENNFKSRFCSKTNVKEEFRDLIQAAKFKYIFLSYNNEGLMSFEDIKEIMSGVGQYGCFETELNRYKADKDENRNYKAKKTIEYLHYVVKG